MGHPPKQLVIGIPAASFDGKYYGRYPQGNKPQGAILVSNAVAQAIANANLSTAIRLGGAALAAAIASGALTTSSGGGGDPYADPRIGYLAGDLVFDASRGSNANAGTLASPKQQIQASDITTALSNNRRIWLRGDLGQQYIPFVDTYNGLMNKNGNSSNRLVVATYPGDPKAEMTGVNVAGQMQFDFQSSYWSFRNIRVPAYGALNNGSRNRNGFWCGENASCDNIQWIDCEFDNSPGVSGYYDNSGAVFLNSCNNHEFIRCKGTGVMPSGFTGGGTASIIMFQCPTIKMIGCEFSGDFGLPYIKHGYNNTDPSTVDVQIKNCVFRDNPFNTAASYAHYDNCLFIDCGSDGLWMGDGSGLSGGNDSVINHCTYVGSSIRLATQGEQRLPANVTIRNSIIQDRGSNTNMRVRRGETSGKPASLLDPTISDYNVIQSDMTDDLTTVSLASRQAGGNDLHSIKGVASFVGSDPNVLAHWALVNGSLGKNAASDGADIGCDFSKLLTVN